MNRNRVKLFLDNFLIYGIGGILNRLIPMIMLPIVTRLYPSSEYIGLNDLNQTFISFAQALAVCGMYDAMFRIYFDLNNIKDQQKVCSTALIFVTGTSILSAALCILFQNQVAVLYFGSVKYKSLVLVTALGFFLSATNQIVSAPTRMQNKKSVFLATNMITSLISYGICIPLILKGYCLYAMPIGVILSATIIEVLFIRMNKDYFRIRDFDFSVLRDLLKIGIPLMPNFIVYWLYNSADKIMISHILGNSYTGIYSVASKIGHISNLIYSAFSGGWLYFAYSTMNDNDQIQLKSDIFEYLGAISFACAILAMGVSKISFWVLFPKEYLCGYLSMPYLFVSPLLLMLYQVIANQFSIAKKTYLNIIALLSGAVLNIILNIILIPRIGIEGASIATVIGYIISIVICLTILLKLKLISINKPVYINVLILFAYYLVWRCFIHDKCVISAIIAVLTTMIYVLRYRKPIMKTVRNFKKQS